MAAAVFIENLKKSYGNVVAVQDVSFQVQPGEIFGLLGPNGAGKTTTLRALCTLTTPDAGKIEVSGISVLDHPKLARQKLGYVAQEVALDAASLCLIELGSISQNCRRLQFLFLRQIDP